MVKELVIGCAQSGVIPLADMIVMTCPRDLWHSDSMKPLYGLIFLATGASADPATIEDVSARFDDTGWTLHVTLRHADTGWDDYADGWRVLAPDGTVLATRVLAHPHVNEQPFTRSKSGIAIDDGVANVLIESSTNVTGWSGEKRVFELP